MPPKPKTYNNQKTIHFNNAPKDAQHPYSIYSNEALDWAYKNLSIYALHIYMYLGRYRNSNGFALSRKDITNKLHISENTYHRAIKELQERGYLVKGTQTDTLNIYVLNELVATKEDNLTWE